jgi:hypothetical protein
MAVVGFMDQGRFDLDELVLYGISISVLAKNRPRRASNIRAIERRSFAIEYRE